MKEKSIFETLSKIDVSSFIEKKNGLSYLSWSYALAYALKEFPNLTYEVLKNENGLPYFIDDNGAMVYTKITIDGITREMWLPVMDVANKAMKSKPYSYKTRYGEKSVEAIDMFAVNKTVMRCLVKNLAVFGLGINVYSGEDLPLDLSEEKDGGDSKKTDDKASKKQVEELKKLAKEAGIPDSRMKEKYGASIYTTPYLKTYNKAKKEIEDYINKKK